MDKLITTFLEFNNIREIVESLSINRSSNSNLKNKQMHTFLRNRIRKGDVLVAGPQRKPSSRTVTAYYTASKGMFGENNVHVDMYSGKGKLVTVDERGVVNRSLRNLSNKRNHVTILRPTSLSAKERNKVVKHAQAQIGKSFNKKLLGGALIKEISPKLPTGPFKEMDNAFTCSGLLAQSLDKGGVKVAPDKARSFVAPKDFRRSPDLKQVMVFDRDSKTNRWKVTR